MTWVGGTWSQPKLADGWEARQDPECLTITCSDEVAFQLSAARSTTSSHGRSAVISKSASRKTPNPAMDRPVIFDAGRSIKRDARAPMQNRHRPLPFDSRSAPPKPPRGFAIRPPSFAGAAHRFTLRHSFAGGAAPC